MKIEFLPASKEVEISVDMPEPAKNLIPEWYKSKPRFTNSGKPEIQNGVVTNNSIKSCVPFYDAMTYGYIQKTWCDIYIDLDENENVLYNYSRYPDIMSHRDSPAINIPNIFYPTEFIWRVQWIPKLPPGWSVLMTSPLNRTDLPFFSLSGVIDSDLFYHLMPANYPFYIKKGFTGLIPKGTPMYQIIPIKRENWQSSIKNISDEDKMKLSFERHSYFFGAYKRFFHKKKSFK